MNKIKILILEDEPLHAAKLEMFLTEMGYQVLPIADNAEEGIRIFHATQPDLVILDIQLKGEMNGIEFAEKISQSVGGRVPVIFLTAMNDTEMFDQAKQTNPYAYLLKPIDRFSIQHAIEVALQLALSEKENQANKALESILMNKQNLFIKEQKKLYKVAVNDISVIEVDGKYCEVYTSERKLLVRTSLKELFHRLPENLFLQTHRNFLVNVNQIEQIELDNDIIKTKEREVPISKNYKSAIMNNLNFMK